MDDGVHFMKNTAHDLNYLLQKYDQIELLTPKAPFYRVTILSSTIKKSCENSAIGYGCYYTSFPDETRPFRIAKIKMLYDDAYYYEFNDKVTIVASFLHLEKYRERYEDHTSALQGIASHMQDTTIVN